MQADAPVRMCPVYLVCPPSPRCRSRCCRRCCLTSGRRLRAPSSCCTLPATCCWRSARPSSSGSSHTRRSGTSELGLRGAAHTAQGGLTLPAVQGWRDTYAVQRSSSSVHMCGCVYEQPTAFLHTCTRCVLLRPAQTPPSTPPLLCPTQACTCQPGVCGHPAGTADAGCGGGGLCQLGSGVLPQAAHHGGDS